MNRRLNRYSKELWFNIRKLEGKELKRFKTLLKTKSGKATEGIWVNLFTIYRSMRVFSMRKVLEKLNTDKTVFRLAERKLATILAKSCAGSAMRSPRVGVSERIKAAEIFYLKGNLNLARREVVKARKICIAYELFEEEHHVLEWQLKIAIDSEDWRETNFLNQEIILLGKKQTQLNWLKILFIAWITDKPVTESPNGTDLNFWLEFLVNNKNELASVRAGIIFALVAGSKKNGPNENDYEILLGGIKLIGANPKVTLSNPNIVILLYRAILVSLFQQANYAQIEEILIQMAKTRFLSPSQNIRIAEIIQLFWFRFHAEQQHPSETDVHAKKIALLLESYKTDDWALRHQEMAFYLAHYYLNCQKPRNALELVIVLLHSDKHIPLPAEYKSKVLNLEISVHGALNNQDLVENKTRNLKRRLSASETVKPMSNAEVNG